MNLPAIPQAVPAPRDYTDPATGLLMCGKCRTAKEAFFPQELCRSLGVRKHPVECRCAAEARQAREAREEQLRHRRRVDALRAAAFRDFPTAGRWRFASAATPTAQLEKARQYALHWEEFFPQGTGLLLFGDVGTGKSYAAFCIANALLEREVSVACAALTGAVAAMQSAAPAERETYLKGLLGAQLLVLDDLGAERSTSYGRERGFDLINRRVNTGKPMVVTTNLSLTAMQNTQALDERRIYDRVLEVCVPLRFTGESFRRENARARLAQAAALLNSPDAPGDGR